MAMGLLRSAVEVTPNMRSPLRVAGDARRQAERDTCFESIDFSQLAVSGSQQLAKGGLLRLEIDRHD
jgi:hypothetical protein